MAYKINEDGTIRKSGIRGFLEHKGILRKKQKPIKPTRYMRAKCMYHNNEYLIKMEQRSNGNWYMVDTLPVEYSNADIHAQSIALQFNNNGPFSGSNYKCFLCSNKNIIRCGICKKITCYDNSGQSYCAYCRRWGAVSSEYITSVNVEDSGGKKSLTLEELLV